MSDHDPEKFRLALRQMALDAALDSHDNAPPQDFEPLSLEVENRLVQLADEHHDAPAQALVPAPAAAVPPAISHAADATSHIRRRNARLRSRSLWITLGVAVAAAAAVAVVPWGGRPPVSGGSTYVAVTPMAVQLPGQDGKLMLGGANTIGRAVSALRLARSQTLSLVLFPQKGGSEAEQVYAFIRHKNQPPRQWGVVPQKTDHGAFVLNIPLREAPAIEPEQDLLFVFGPAGPAPDPLALEKSKRPDAYSLVTVHLLVTN